MWSCTLVSDDGDLKNKGGLVHSVYSLVIYGWESLLCQENLFYVK
jgi:hypothetical protein